MTVKSCLIEVSIAQWKLLIIGLANYYYRYSKLETACKGAHTY